MLPNFAGNEVDLRLLLNISDDFQVLQDAY